jgi:23S rRNA (guanosine2251-2'-O)-methyltransferase
MESRKSRPHDRWGRQPERKPERHPAQSSSSLQRIPPSHAIFGMHAAEAALLNAKRNISHAYLTENGAARLGALIASRAIPATPSTPAALDALLGGDAVHQGIVLHVEPLTQPDLASFLESLPEGARSKVAILDQVTDPHNVGAVLRSAAAFGISALIVQARHSPPLSGTLAKAASGALEHVPVIETVNLARALDKLKEHDFYCIGFDSEAELLFGGEAVTSPRLAFVFGAEDKGIRRLVREACDGLYALSAPGQIKSLNVSNAAAIVFYEAAKSAGEARQRTG